MMTVLLDAGSMSLLIGFELRMGNKLDAAEGQAQSICEQVGM
jgi:hypothetical protein